LASNTALYKSRDYFQSQKFSSSFGTIIWPEQLDYILEIVKDFYQGRRMKTDGMLTITTESGEETFEYHFLIRPIMVCSNISK